jgi:hypothetical protein
MKFTVLWTASAQSRLAAIWLQASDRAAVTKAARAIDVALRLDAQHLGESRAGRRRIAHETPLGAIFSVNVSARAVLVLDVWRYEKPSS